MLYGPLRKPYKKDLEMMHFGWIIVVEYDGINAEGFQMWYCRCNACGTYKSIMGHSLLSGATTSCGCRKITHGLTRGPRGTEKPTEYKSWIQAKDRCHNPKSASYGDYGGRGIVMCDGWRNDYAEFFEAMGPKPKGTSIERVNVNGNYSCGKCPQCVQSGWSMNCKWGTAKEQARNRRSTVFIEHEGQRKSLAEWAESLGLDLRKLWDRLYRYKMPVALAFSKK